MAADYSIQTLCCGPPARVETGAPRHRSGEGWVVRCGKAAVRAAWLQAAVRRDADVSLSRHAGPDLRHVHVQLLQHRSGLPPLSAACVQLRRCTLTHSAALLGAAHHGAKILWPVARDCAKLEAQRGARPSAVPMRPRAAPSHLTLSQQVVAAAVLRTLCCSRRHLARADEPRSSARAGRCRLHVAEHVNPLRLRLAQILLWLGRHRLGVDCGTILWWSTATAQRMLR